MQTDNPILRPAVKKRQQRNKQERRRTLRHELRIRVQLWNSERKCFQNAHLDNINHTGIYLMTRYQLALNQNLEIAIPTEAEGDPIKIKARVTRLGNHRSWGLFSYGCRILQCG